MGADLLRQGSPGALSQQVVFALYLEEDAGKDWVVGEVRIF